METKDIVEIFAESGFQIHPQTLEILKSKNYTPSQIEGIIESLDDSIIVVKKEDLLQDSKTEVHEVRVVSDTTENLKCKGEYNEFVNYFQNRYNTLSNMLRKRISSRPIESLKNTFFDTKEHISVIGMVYDIKESTNGHKLIDIEDTTGIVRVLVNKENKELFNFSNTILLDEVIGVTGALSKDKGLIFAENIIKPDIPNSNANNYEINSKGKAVFISDVHIGSKTFLEDSWIKFTEWIENEIDYLIIAGDLVDGIGVFPNQEKELKIDDIYEQYKKASEYINDLASHIKVIISPGNHDAVRQAEPQPCLPDKIKNMFNKNVIFVGNPANIKIGDVSILIYHGRSLDDIIASVPGFSYSEPTKPMIEMLKIRHLSPVYGGRVSIAPVYEDNLVINNLPNIFHCGHVHTYGVTKYKGILTINSGTWQSQTDFQKKMNLQPVTAKATVVNLENMNYEIANFG